MYLSFVWEAAVTCASDRVTDSQTCMNICIYFLLYIDIYGWLFVRHARVKIVMVYIFLAQKVLEWMHYIIEKIY